MNLYKFPCGCQFPIINDSLKGYDGFPELDIDFDNIRLNCPSTWAMFCEGRTKGVFQLEKQLGQTWAAKLQPMSIEECADLISVIRPGTLKARLNNKSMTQHYVDRKHGIDTFENFVPEIEHILRPTYGILVYQEQSMKIAQVLAGFDLKQADTLRKAMGKKDAKLMMKVKEEFLAGAAKLKIVSEKKAEEIFANIQASNRYAFNKSHAIAYGLTAYQTMYAKCHFPLAFFTGWLHDSDNKMDKKEEVALLTNDARTYKLDVLGPSILYSGVNFKAEEKKIRTGLSNIAAIGESKVVVIFEAIKTLEAKLKKPIADFDWHDFLLHFSQEIDKTSFLNLIAVGAFDHLHKFRKEMMFEYNQLLLLTGKHEIPYLQDYIRKHKDLASCVAALALTDKVTSGRKNKVIGIANMLAKPASSLQDDDLWIADVERELIGVALSCSKLDACDLSACNSSCVGFNDTKREVYIIGCIVESVREFITKSGKLAGQKMLFLSLSDKTGIIEAVAFPRAVKDYEPLFIEGNTICVIGKRTDKGSLAIDKATQL